MTDRELLEAAAKAAGIVLLRAPDGSMRNCTGLRPEHNILAAPFWNPLTDDGDALRLACGLRINIEHVRTMAGVDAGVNAWPSGRGDCGLTVKGDDAAAATRRAIVRAAAALGGATGAGGE